MGTEIEIKFSVQRLNINFLEIKAYNKLIFSYHSIIFLVQTLLFHKSD